MVNKEFISKVLENVRNNQMLNILAEHLRFTENDDVVYRFIQMCLYNNNEIKSFIKTKDDFNKMKILEVIDKLKKSRCITNIKEITHINCLTGNIMVTYNYYNVTYHINQDFSDSGLCWETKENKYAKIHTDNVFEDVIILNYYINDILM